MEAEVFKRDSLINSLKEKLLWEGDYDILVNENQRLQKDKIAQLDEIQKLKEIKRNLEVMLKDSFNPAHGEYMLLQKKVEMMERQIFEREMDTKMQIQKSMTKNDNNDTKI